LEEQASRIQIAAKVNLLGNEVVSQMKLTILIEFSAIQRYKRSRTPHKRASMWRIEYFRENPLSNHGLFVSRSNLAK
jgi:hypothetical protein